MDQGLLRAIRDRYSAKSADELLQLWIEIDRGNYSEETFEAVRSLLRERGRELPPQNDPPPMARRIPARRWWLPARPQLEPPAAAWYDWLQVMLAVGAVLLALRLVGSTFTFQLYVRSYLRYGFSGGADAVFTFARGVVAVVVLAGGLFVGGWQALCLRPVGRTLLLAYCLGALALAAVNVASAVSGPSRYADEMPLSYYLVIASEAAYGAAYPTLLWLFLTRPMTKSLFEPVVHGFTVGEKAAPGASPEGSAAGNVRAEELT